MKIAEVQINLWDKNQLFNVNELELKVGDYVIVEFLQTQEIGKVMEIKDVEEKNELEKIKQEYELTPIIRKASLKDLEKLADFEKNKDVIMEVCKKLIIKNQLPMKLVDVHCSFDDKKITFAFIAESRVDFRQLVKDLTKNFLKNIRLQQLGVRDEAKINGDIGACGLTQCCLTHLKELGNVSAEQAEMQQVSHRGAERLSGICNRLKCCLRYENDLYAEMSKNFPAVGDIIKTKRGKAQVVDWHILKQTVNIKLEQEEAIIEIPLQEILKK
jgi:cell fate regulator YaaT (PSP1 superfamily)